MYVKRGSGFWGAMPPVVKNLVMINGVMLLITMLTGEFMYEKFALFYFDSPLFKPYQLVTHMFMHGGFMHLFFNMYALVIFGIVLEQVWGSKKFFIYYMVTGLGAAALHSFVMYLEASSYQTAIEAGNMVAAQNLEILRRTPTVGASGAVYGVLLAYGMLFPNNRLQLLFPPIALKAKYFVMIFAAIELYMGFSNTGGNVAHFAHLGGMLFGYFLIIHWKRHNKMYF